MAYCGTHSICYAGHNGGKCCAFDSLTIEPVGLTVALLGWTVGNFWNTLQPIEPLHMSSAQDHLVGQVSSARGVVDHPSHGSPLLSFALYAYEYGRSYPPHGEQVRTWRPWRPLVSRPFRFFKGLAIKLNPWLFDLSSHFRIRIMSADLGHVPCAALPKEVPCG